MKEYEISCNLQFLKIENEIGNATAIVGLRQPPDDIFPGSVLIGILYRQGEGWKYSVTRGGLS